MTPQLKTITPETILPEIEEFMVTYDIGRLLVSENSGLGGIVTRNVKAPLNGKDLKELGYKPGPLYREILDKLLAATLDGEIDDRSSAESFVRKRYPIDIRVHKET